MAHACNPSTLVGRGWQIMKSRDQDHSDHGETLSPLKIQKNYLGMVESACNPSYSEAEAGELLEPGERRLQ